MSADFRQRKVKLTVIKRNHLEPITILDPEQRRTQDADYEFCQDLAIKAYCDVKVGHFDKPRKNLVFRCLEDEEKNARQYELFNLTENKVQDKYKLDSAYKLKVI